jgi:hypothetical protein
LDVFQVEFAAFGSTCCEYNYAVVVVVVVVDVDVDVAFAIVDVVASQGQV